MSPEEKEYHELMDKRSRREKLTRKEEKRRIELVNKFFNEGVGQVAKAWAGGFGLTK